MSFMAASDKSSALKRISRILGQDYELSRGSTVPSAMFTAAAMRAGVSADGSMPARARRVVEAAGLEWTTECDSTSTESGGGSTVTLIGLNRLLEALELLRA